MFVVSEKWTRGEQSEDKLNHIPSHLLAYATIDGKRVVCAVPTDVQPVARFQAVMSHSASAVYAHDGSIGEYGSATIALQIVGPVSAGEYLLSCQHVLSPEVPIDTGKMLSGIEVFPVTVPTQNGPQPAPTSGPVARSVAYGGRIVDGALPSFDVQLAKILDRPWLKGALQDLTLSIKRPFVTDRAMLDRIAQDSNFEILVPPNHPHWIGKHRRPVVGALATYTNPSLGITYQARINGVTKEILVHHWMLAELRIIGTSMPEAGDSGSAVVASVEEDGVTLIGMHIAAHPTEPHSYLIPAWQLFDRANYWKLPQNAVVRPVNL